MYKKGDKAVYENYRGIKLLGVTVIRSNFDKYVNKGVEAYAPGKL